MGDQGGDRGAEGPGDEPLAPEQEEDALDREAILRRRARFVASAMAGLVLGAGCEPAAPQVCLSPLPDPHPPAGPAASGDAGPAPSGSEAPPQPCLEIPPQPCLRYAPPPEGSVPGAAPAASGSGAPSASAPPPLPPAQGTYPAPCLKIAPPQGSSGR